MPKVNSMEGRPKKAPARRPAAEAMKPLKSERPLATSRRKATAASKARKKTALVEPAGPTLPPSPPSPPPAPMPEHSLADAQSNVEASRYRIESPLRPGQIRTLKSSYGENHLLLLVRDPVTLFAAWDMAPFTSEGLRARLGRRGYAVSNLTLRLIQAGGPTTVFHLAKRTRSRYLKVMRGASYIAEIGLTTPSGRFELFARSGPCHTPAGVAGARPSAPSRRRRTVLGYRTAPSLVRAGALSPRAMKPEKLRGVLAEAGPSTSTPGASVSRAAAESVRSVSASEHPRILGGSSDLYRR